MHTRCAPVRHSRPPEGGLPCDLHVLGLPLAFILSQDQTLRCNVVVLTFSCFLCSGLRLGLTAPFLIPPDRPRHHCPGVRLAVLASSFQRSPANSLLYQAPLPSFAGAKVQLSPLPAMSFFNFFSSYSIFHCKSRRKIFTHHWTAPLFDTLLY